MRYSPLQCSGVQFSVWLCRVIFIEFQYNALTHLFSNALQYLRSRYLATKCQLPQTRMLAEYVIHCTAGQTKNMHYFVCLASRCSPAPNEHLVNNLHSTSVPVTTAHLTKHPTRFTLHKTHYNIYT